MLMDTLVLMKGIAQSPNNPTEVPICDYHRQEPEWTCPYVAGRTTTVINVNKKKPRNSRIGWVT